MPIRILIAEDNVTNLKVAQYVLHKAGYVVESAKDGCQAVEACLLKDYDVVLMDCQMPEMDGLEATRRIRKLNRLQPIIIAVTAHALAGDREKCIECGMDDYLSKPYHANQLLQLVREHVERS